MNMNTKFFKKDIITEYAKRIKPTLNKNDVSILHREQIGEFILDSGVAANLSRKPEPTEKMKEYLKTMGKSGTTTREERVATFKMQRATEIIQSCIDKCPNIGSTYIENSLKFALDTAYPKYDIVLLVDNHKRVTQIESRKNKTSKQNNPTNNNNKTVKRTPSELNKIELEEAANKSAKEAASRILGVLIVQKGECYTRPKTVSIKLICASSIDNPESRHAKKLGSILLGLYLYTLKKNIENGERLHTIGLLELSGSYKNLPGYCAYSKFGFIEDNSADIGEICYKDAGLLPMYVDLNKLDYDKIVDIVNETGKLSAKPHKLCSEQFRNLDETKKELVIELYDILDYLHAIIEEKFEDSYLNERTEPYMPGRNFSTMKRIISIMENRKNVPPEIKKEMVDIKAKLINNGKDTFLALSIDELKRLCGYVFSTIVSVLPDDLPTIKPKSKSKSPEKVDEIRSASIPIKPIDTVPKKKLYDRLKSVFTRRKKSPEINTIPKQKVYDSLKGWFTRKNKSTEKVPVQIP